MLSDETMMCATVEELRSIADDAALREDYRASLETAASWMVFAIKQHERLQQQRAELLEALKRLVGGYEDTTATGMMDMLVIGEDVRRAVNAITKAEADK